MYNNSTLLRDLTASGIYNRNKGIRQALVPSNAAPGSMDSPMGSMGSPMGTMGNPMMMTSAPGDETAFNERNKNRAMYGDRWNTKGGIGRPGIMRETIGANAMSAALKNQTEQGKILSDAQEKQKDRNNALKIAKIKAKGDGLGVNGDPSGLTLKGPQISGPGQTAGATQVPPSIPGNPAVPNQQIATQQSVAPNEASFPEPGTRFDDLKKGTGYITVPSGSQDKKIAKPGTYAMNAQGQTKYTPPIGGAPAASAPASQASLPSRMDSGMMDGYPNADVAPNGQPSLSAKKDQAALTPEEKFPITGKGFGDIKSIFNRMIPDKGFGLPWGDSPLSDSLQKRGKTRAELIKAMGKKRRDIFGWDKLR